MAAESFFDYHQRMRDRSARAVQPSASTTPAQPLTVSQLTAQIERALKAAFAQPVVVRAEVSNFKRHGQSGHMYFVLKDPANCIDCVMFKSDAARLKFMPEDGMEVLVTGRVAVYGARGRYQLYVTRIDPLGQGALELAFRQLCQRLEKEGLFSAERKRPLPLYPRTIALVTSTQTAALQDMLKVLRRYGFLRLLVCHVPVQGEGAAQKIAAALTELNQQAAALGGIDLILLGRGGGSLEDLWAFNDEIVARAVVASDIPIVTGIGHEVDVSIADLAADYHAHTPTEAAQVAVTHWRSARDTVEQNGIRLRRQLRSLVQELRQRLAHLSSHELFRRPADRINALRQLLDDRQRGLTLGINQHLRTLQQRSAVQWAALREHHPRHRLELARQRLCSGQAALHRQGLACLSSHQQKLAVLAGKLEALGPQQVMKRGYSITTLKRGGVIVKSSAQVKAGDKLLTRLADGTVESIAQDSRQMSLFD